MKYTALEFDNIKTLIQAVNEHIQAGWQPLGGICVTTNSQYAHPKYIQAMIKG